jgi:hypothetical protein
MPDVFISYASADRQAVSPIAEVLTVLGLDVWFDQKLHVGEHWDEEIERELQAALTVVVCWSPNSIASGWVMHEATVAQQKKNLVSLYIEECTAPGPHARIQGIKLVGWKGELHNPAWLQLLARLEVLLQRNDLIRSEKARAATLPQSPSVTLAPGFELSELKLLYGRLDNAQADELSRRYDFSDTSSSSNPLTLDETGACWLDYVGNPAGKLPDDSCVPYLLGLEEIQVPLGNLRQGDILILGGGQVDPNRTKGSGRWMLDAMSRWPLFIDFRRYRMRRRLTGLYREQIVELLRGAANTAPKQKLFAIPGWGDRYDGLVAFDNLFCTSRGAAGNAIGAWQCVQHRSYWHLRLPYGWWIWGIDIAFDEPFDRDQATYFNTIAEQMGPQDNLILMTSEPFWVKADLHGGDEEENFFRIVAIARARGIRICAAIASNTAHYNHYYAPELDVHFFVAGGGGGVSLEPTHILRNSISVRWPVSVVDEAENKSDAPPAWKAIDYDIRLKRDIGSSAPRLVGTMRKREPLKPQAPKCYPDKATSYLLSLGNLLFPFYNRVFALGFGLLYWLITWDFQTLFENGFNNRGIGTLVAGTTLVAMLTGLYTVLYWYVDAIERPSFRRHATKLVVGTSHFLAHMASMYALWRVGLASYPPLMIVAGALVGGSIWGLYWVLTTLLGRMHSADSFAALRIKKYRNFLRLKFERDRLTIYPLRIDNPLQPRDWIRTPRHVPKPPSNPARMPIRPIDVQLIENPIVIISGE